MKQSAYFKWTMLAFSAGLFATNVFAAQTNVATTHGSDTNSYLIEVEFPQIQVNAVETNGQLYHEFSFEKSGYYSQPGAPDIPIVSQLIEMPDQSGIQLRLVSEEFVTLQDINPMPCQERMHGEFDYPLEWLQDEEIFNQNSFFPGVSYAVADPAIMRNHRVSKASFFPVQVNPVSGDTRIWSRMTFEVSFEGENPVNQKEYQLSNDSGNISRLFAQQIINPEMAANGQISDFLLDPGDLPGNYLVFGYNATFSDPTYTGGFLEWKRRRGHRVVLVDENEINFATASADDIKDRIIQEYQSEFPVDYVLLLGDVNGTYHITTGPTGYSLINGGYDHYYACIEGSDILGDVAVGRISADSAQEMAKILRKITRYESQPYVTDSSWLNHSAFLVASEPYCALSMINCCRNISAEMVDSRNYTDIDTTWCSNSTPVIPWFNEGISHYAYRGWIGMEGLSQSGIEGLTQGDRTPVVTIFTCSTGDFHSSDDFSESFLRAGNISTGGGAVACMGFATSSTHTRDNNVVCTGFYGSLLEYDVPEVGASLLQGKYELYQSLPYELAEAADFANWANLMGDPGTVMWAGALGNLNIDSPGSLASGTSHLALTVTSGGSAVEGVIVCAYQEQAGDTMQVVSLTDASGQVLLDINEMAIGTLMLTASHRRFVPILENIPVTQMSADAEITVWDIEGAQSFQPGLSGQELSFTLRNSGTSTLNSVSVTPMLDSAFGSLSGGTFNVGTLSAGSSTVLSGTIINPASSIIDGTLLPLMLNVQSSQGDFELLINAYSSAPYFEPGTYSFPGGSLGPGATGTVSAQIINEGSLNALSMNVMVVSDDLSVVIVTSGLIAVGNVSAGSPVNVEFNVELANTVNIGQSLPLHLEWSSNSDQITGLVYLSVPVGNPGVNDPTGTDYGYWAYENQDSSYDLAPDYEWIEIVPAEGGSGSMLPLTDHGDEQDDMATVALPFPFTYYGENYTRMLINSNGFGSFTENDSHESDFGNHYLPAAFGPDAMIAPMWDDHYTPTTGNSGVYYWYNSANHQYVITWYHMNAYSQGGPNTFQLVLYDPAFYSTVSGDGPFLFQYQDFNDTQMTPGTWGHADMDKCTVGMKDHTSTRGLTLSHSGQLNSTMHSITDGTAIFFTTAVGDFVDYIAPTIIPQTPANYLQGSSITIEASITDMSGIASAICYWSVDGGTWVNSSMIANGSTYTLDIGSYGGGTEITYYIVAVDGSGQSNETTSDNQSISVTFPPIFVEDFETTSAFTHTSGNGRTDQWHLENARQHAGVNSYKFGGDGTTDYANDAGGILTSPVINIPVGSTDLDCNFWSWMEAETSSAYPDSAYDCGLVEFRLDGGSWLQADLAPGYVHTIRSISTLTDWLPWPLEVLSGTQNWENYSFAIPDGTLSLEVRFLFGSDQGAVREGWYIDDIALTGIISASLDPVTDLAIESVAGNIILSWTAVPGASSYTIYSKNDPYVGPAVVIGSTSNVYHVIQTADVRKFYYITANN
jgi:hypothetical protein